MNIFQEIRKDHEKQKLLLRILVETEGNSDMRKEHFDRLKEALKVHESAERKHFYDPLLERKKTRKTAQNVAFGLHEIDEKVTELDNTNMNSSAWLHKMKELQDLLLDHIAADEALLFNKADKTLTEVETRSLGEDYVEEKRKTYSAY